MQITRIGDFEVQRLTEFEGPFIAPEVFFPDFDPEVLRANPDMAGPRLIDPASGKLVFSFHCFIVKTGHHTILIDSCLGNDKERPTRPQFHRLRTPFLADLANAGINVGEVDFVMCTHLHWDHVGWNTRLDKRAVGPDLSNARYIMARREFEHWQGVQQRGEDSPTASPSRTACCRSCAPANRCWSTMTTRSRTDAPLRCGSRAPPATPPAMS